MIELFSCGTEKTFSGVRPFHEAKTDNVKGRSVILVASADVCGSACAELNDLGAARIVTINADSPTVDDDLSQALHAERAAAPERGKVSTTLLKAGTACSVKFPHHILGDRLEGIVKSLGRLSGAADEYVFSTLLTTVAGIVSGYYKFQVRPGFVAPSVVWTVNVGDSSSNKSVAQGMVTSPLSEIERDSFAKHRAAAKEAKSVDNKDTGPVTPPTRVSIFNATLEAAQMVCAEQSRGVLNRSDEFSTLAGFATGRYKQGGYVGDFCTAYNGDDLIVDRRSLKEPLDIKCWGMSITSNCPPSVLSQIAQQTTLLTDNSGFDQRLWYFWPPLRDLEVRPAPDDHLALVALKALYQYLFQVRQRPGVLTLKMDDRARESYEDWRIKWLEKARRQSSEVGGWEGKIVGVVLRCAGLFAVMDAAFEGRDPTSITFDHFKRGVALADCLSAHRRRVELERGQPPVERLAAELASWIIEQKAKTLDTFELRRSVIPGIRSEATLRAVLLELQAAKWLETAVSPRRDESLPTLVKIRPQVFDLIKTH